MMQTGRVRVEAGNVTFVVQHELWDGNIQDHSDQGVVILVEAGDATALRFNCFDRERSYVYGPEGKNIKFRMDETVDGNPIGWSVKTLRNSIGIMLTEAGYGEAAGAVDLAAVNKALDEVEETARYKFAAERNTVKHNRGTDVFEAGNIKFGLKTASWARATAAWPSTSSRTWLATRAACSPRKRSCWPSTASGTARTTTMAHATRTTASTGTRPWCPTRWAGAWTSSRARS